MGRKLKSAPRSKNALNANASPPATVTVSADTDVILRFAIASTQVHPELQVSKGSRSVAGSNSNTNAGRVVDHSTSQERSNSDSALVPTNKCRSNKSLVKSLKIVKIV